jgi:NAD(P)-dependent dehydrogenase (short-subunit alcohol dehydrogenase family)
MAKDQNKYGSKLAGTTVLVTGGTSGLGYGLAEALLEQVPQPAHIIVSSSNVSKVDKAVARLKAAYPNATQKVKLTGVACNLGDEENLEANLKKMFEGLPLDGKKIDHIVHTAGDPLAITNLEAIDMAFVKKAGMVRYFAPLFIAKHAARYMAMSPDTSITFTGGGIADGPNKGWFVVGGYAAGLQGLSRSLAKEMQPIRVNLVQPGAVSTILMKYVSVKTGYISQVATIVSISGSPRTYTVRPTCVAFPTLLFWRKTLLPSVSNTVLSILKEDLYALPVPPQSEFTDVGQL